MTKRFGIDGGVVVQTWCLGTYDPENPPEGTLEGPDDVFNGFSYDAVTGQFSAPAQPPEPPPVLTKYQVLMGLLSIGIKEADVEDKLVLLPVDQVNAATIAWKYSVNYRREDPLVATLAAMFELPASQVDDLWAWASGL